MSEKTKKQTIEEWRKLGFYYDRDDTNKRWIIVGSKRGLEAFAILLRDYAVKNAKPGYHDHLGPYAYLSVRTSNTLAVTIDGIAGSSQDFLKLSSSISQAIASNPDTGIISVSSLSDENFEYSVALVMRNNEFDPATEDPQLA